MPTDSQDRISLTMHTIEGATSLQRPDALRPNDIHVWQLGTKVSGDDLTCLRATLSDEELARAGRFRFNEHRDTFICSRGILRLLLSHYVGKTASALELNHSSYGKPFIQPLSLPKPIEFNISHSGTLIMWVFASNRRLGIDVEKIDAKFSSFQIAEHFFSPQERQALALLPPQQFSTAFFQCWTRKEAFIKALGEGLSHPLDRFDVTLGPGVPPRLVATRPDAREAERWGMWDIQVPQGYSSALVAELQQSN